MIFTNLIDILSNKKKWVHQHFWIFTNYRGWHTYRHPISGLSLHICHVITPTFSTNNSYCGSVQSTAWDCFLYLYPFRITGRTRIFWIFERAKFWLIHLYSGGKIKFSNWFVSRFRTIFREHSNWYFCRFIRNLFENMFKKSAPYDVRKTWFWNTFLNSCFCNTCTRMSLLLQVAVGLSCWAILPNILLLLTTIHFFHVIPESISSV
mgnify:CR=1 FL=1